MRFFPTRRIGLITPSANPAFEPELRALLPDDIAVHATRLPVMPGTTLQERNARYVFAYEDAIKTFGDLKLDAMAIGLTGPSYGMPQSTDIALQTLLTEKAGTKLILPSRAIADALERLELRRVVIFSPYPGWLTDRAEDYWRAAGLDIVDVFKVSDTFRAYELTPREVIAALGRVRAPADSAVIMSGTGMATLDALEACQPAMEAVLLPSNLAVAFALLRAIGAEPSPAFRELSPTLARRV
jgi:maleate isomerase